MNNKEQEEQLIHQIARLISIYDVYCNLVKYGKNGEYSISYQFSKENILILLLSNLYALFDDQKDAQSLYKIEFSNSKVEILKKDIVNQWERIKTEITIIRHNIGFHTAKKIDGQKKAIEQFKQLGEKPFELIREIKKFRLFYMLNQ